MAEDKDYWTLGIISAIVAGNMKAVEAIILALVSVDPSWSTQVAEAILRGSDSRRRGQALANARPGGRDGRRDGCDATRDPCALT